MWGHVHATKYMWTAKDNSVELVLSFSTIGGFCVLPFVSQIREMDKWHENTDGEDRGSAVNHPECDSQGFWRCVGLWL